MIILTNKSLENKIKYLEQLVKDSTALIETIKTYKNNGACLLLENLDEVVIEKLNSMVDEDKTVVLFSKDGKRIEIKKKDKEEKKRRVFF